MKRLLLPVFVVLLISHRVFADAPIKWGPPVNGLRVGIESPVTSVTSDHDLTFTVTAQNVSSQPITLPTPDTFLLRSGRNDGFHETPLSPVITRATFPLQMGVVAVASSSPIGPKVEDLQSHVVTLAPGQSVTWNDVPLGKSYYSPFLQFNHQTEIEKSVLYPDSLYHIQFRFENDQTPVANAVVWTGQADSGTVDIHVNPPSLDGIKVKGGFSLPKQIYFLGDPIEATFTVTNRGETPIHFPAGGDYRASGRHDRFSIHAVDSWGWSVTDPLWWKRFFPAMGGGLGGLITVKPDESYTEKVLINQWCAFSRAGKYKITCKRTLNVSIFDDKDPNRYSMYSKPESSLPAVPIETTLEVTIEDKPWALPTSIANLYSWLLGHRESPKPQETSSPAPKKPAPNPKITEEERRTVRELYTNLLQAMQKHDEAMAVPLAQEILKRDPLEKWPSQVNLRHEALGALNIFGKMDAYLDDLNRQLAADPNSLRLNLLAAEAYGSRNGTAGKIVTLTSFATPAWLKLARKGNTFTASYSTDGQNWNDVFTRDAKMDASALAGLMVSPNSVAEGHVTWKDVQVNGESMVANGLPDASSSSSSLPAPWQYSDIGWQWFHAGAQWNGAELKMNSPVSKGSPNFFFQDYGCVYRPIDGDGEIVACLDSLTSQNDGSWAGLCFRTRTDDTCPFVEFYCDHLHRAHLSIHSDAPDASVRFYKRAADLASNDPVALRMIAMELRSAHRPDDANLILAASYMADFPKDGINVMDALPVFESANQLEEFIKIIEDWNPYDFDVCRMLIRMGDELQLTNHPDEAERVYRKVLSMSLGPSSKQDADTSLVHLLIETNRQDEAAEQFEKGFMGRDSSSWMPWLPHPPDLIFLSDAWYKITDTKRFAEIDDRTIPLLEMANDLGLYSKLKQQLDARAGSTSLTLSTPVDPSRLASILLSIIARDPGYRPELDKLLNDLSNLPSFSQNFPQEDGRNAMAASGLNFNALLLLCEQLAKWPEERPEALRLAQFDFHGHLDGTPDNYTFRIKAEYQVLCTALASGDHAMAREILREIIGSVQRNRAQSPGWWPVDRAPVVRMMIQEGMFQEAAQILADSQSDSQVVNDAAYRQKLDQVKTELAFAQGQVNPDGLIYGLTTAPGQTTTNETLFFWQINAGEKGNDTYPGHAHVSLSDVLWTEADPVRPTDYRIEVQAGPDEDHLTDLATYEKVATCGNAPLEIPPGTRILKALLFPTASTDTASSTNSPPLAIGHTLIWGDSENLLKNPRFEVSKNAQGMAEIAGWHGLLPSNVTQVTGGPMPSGGYQLVEAPNERADMSAFEVSSDVIPLKPGTDYLFSAWQHDGLAPRFFFLDANGTELRSPQSASCERHDGWQWCAWRLIHSYRDAGNDIPIPPQAAFVRILFAHTWKVADVSFRAVPVTTEETNTIQAKPQDAKALIARGKIYLVENNYDKAIADFDRAIQLNSLARAAYFQRGRAYGLKGEYAKAISDFKSALKIQPDFSPAYNNLAWLLATCPQAAFRDGGQAVENATKACELSQWKLPNQLDTLAAAYAEAGDFDNAVKWESKFLETPQLSPEIIGKAKDRLSLYQSHKPYHREDPPQASDDPR